MPHIKILPIKKLQPTHTALSISSLEEVTASENERTDLPEVWEIDKRLIVADGHHRIYLAFLRGQKKMNVNYHCPESSQIGKAGYDCAIQEIAEKAEYCKQNGVCSFSDMVVQ